MEIDGAQRDPMIEATLLLLAGGESRRMGRPKALLPVGGMTLVEWQVSRLAAEFAETLISVAATDQLPDGLRGLAVLDRRMGWGPLAGLEAGLAAARCRQVFALAVDVPSVTAPQARELLRRLGAGADAAVPQSPRGPEPLAAAYRRVPALRALTAALAAGERRVGDLLKRLDVVYVDQPAPANLNTPSDYEAFLDN